MTLADGGRAHLVMVTCAGKASALALVRDEARTDFALASGLFEAGAAEASFEDLLPLLSRSPLARHEFARFDVQGSYGSAIGAGMLMTKLMGLRGALTGDAGYVQRFERLRAPPEADPVLGLPYDCRHDLRPPPFPVSGPLAPPPRAAPGARPESFLLAVSERDLPRITLWLDELSRDFQPGHGLVLGPGAWSPQAVGYYAEPGPVGRWRRQAAALHPAFAGTILHDAGLRALVDAGRPFEGRLLELLAHAASGLGTAPGWTPLAGGITPAKVRRLRTFRGALFGQGNDAYRQVLEPLARLPLANVPSTAEGWDALRGWPVHVIHDLARARIPLETALAGIPEAWDLAALLGGQDAATVLGGMQDMASRLSATLLRPVHGDGCPRADLDRLALHLLFREDGLARMARRQRDWHADLSRMNPVLDDGISLAWPALFEPYRSGGTEVRCLTSTAELDAEGGAGVDERGMAGLDHCVGGYARTCYDGVSHVASVTGPAPDGGRVRLATVEITVEQRRFAVRQLRGPSNRHPSEAAVAAVDALVAALNDRVHPHDRLAAEERDTQGEFAPASIDLAAVYEAWRPHLPNALRVAEPKAFPALLRALVEAWRRLGPETDAPSAAEEPEELPLGIR